MNNCNPLLSIITPVYNRGELLKTCWESLVRQTDKDFEWIVVDDGSTDGSADVVRALPDAGFSVILVEKENGGKHTALNASHGHIHGRYVLILDSDDYLVDTAVEQVRQSWDRFAEDQEIGIVTLLKGSGVDTPSCMAPDEGVAVDIMRYQRRCFFSGDCCEVIRSELFLKYPFPVFAGERFLSEGALWNRVSFTHKCVYINSVIYIADYLEGGLTKSGKPLRIRNPRGGMYTANLNMHPKNFLKRRIKAGILFACYGCFADLTPAGMLRQSDNKLLAALTMPAGWLLYLYWKKKYL